MLSGFGGGEIWASQFSYNSPINDILNADSFTLEQVLEEDEVIQETRTANQKLIQFISEYSQIERMIRYVIEPPSADADEMEKFKYPYMSCEVICCEVNDIIFSIVNPTDTSLLDLLFSILDTEEELNAYSAGYFEKILEMLFRKATDQMMRYLNTKGETLFLRFLHHISNYSIMQIAQRLLLPNIPFSMEVDDNFPRCTWVDLPNTTHHLLSRLISGRSIDIPLHLAELLITVTQLSPLDSLFVQNMCSPDILRVLVGSAFSVPDILQEIETSNQRDLEEENQEQEEQTTENPVSDEKEDDELVVVASPSDEVIALSDEKENEEQEQEQQEQQEEQEEQEEASTNENDDENNEENEDNEENDENQRPKEVYENHPAAEFLKEEADMIKARTLSCITVFEALLSRISDPSNPLGGPEMEVDLDKVKRSTVNVVSTCERYMHFLSDLLSEYLSVETMTVMQNKRRTRILGQKGLQLVKLVEALVRLNQPRIDRLLISTQIVEKCLDLSFRYEMNSMLHLSVQRIVLASLEGGRRRRKLQRHILAELKLLERIVRVLVGDDPESENRAALTRGENMAHARNPILGHLTTLAQAIVGVCHAEMEEGDEMIPIGPMVEIEDSIAAGIVSSSSSSTGQQQQEDNQTQATGAADNNISSPQDVEEGQQEQQSEEEDPMYLYDIVKVIPLPYDWVPFVQGTLTRIINEQEWSMSPGMYQDYWQHEPQEYTTVTYPQHTNDMTLSDPPIHQANQQQHDDDDDDDDAFGQPTLTSSGSVGGVFSHYGMDSDTMTMNRANTEDSSSDEEGDLSDDDDDSDSDSENVQSDEDEFEQSSGSLASNEEQGEEQNQIDEGFADFSEFDIDDEQMKNALSNISLSDEEEEDENSNQEDDEEQQEQQDNNEEDNNEEEQDNKEEDQEEDQEEEGLDVPRQMREESDEQNDQDDNNNEEEEEEEEEEHLPMRIESSSDGEEEEQQEQQELNKDDQDENEEDELSNVSFDKETNN